MIRRALHRWKDERRRTRKRLPALSLADVLFISHAKSGRTWLRALMSNVWHQTYGVPENELIEFGNFKAFDPRIPNIGFTHDLNEPRQVRRRLESLVRSKSALLLLRDPCDIAVSYYFQHARRSTPLTRRRLGLPEDLATLPIGAFMLNPRFGLPSILAFEARWRQRVATAPRSLIIHYEALRANPVRELQQLMLFLGTDADAAVLERATSFASFEALRNKERQGFFASERLRPADEADSDSFKVRRGKIGGWRDYLSTSEVEAVEALVANNAVSESARSATFGLSMRQT